MHASLLVSEAMFDPSPPSVTELFQSPTLTSDDFEFVEFYNPTESDIPLQGIELNGDVGLSFPDEQLAPGEYVVAVSNLTGFQIRYRENAARVIGQWEGKLSNEQASLLLDDSDGHQVLNLLISQSDEWPKAAFDVGSSLERLNLANPTDPSRPGSWRASSPFGGSPGTHNSTAIDLVINEVVANSVLRDSIELHNRGDSAIDASGWYLSDSPETLAKFQLSENTVIEAGGFLTLFDSDFDPTPDNRLPEHLQLDGIHGGELWLTASIGPNGPDLFIDHAEWGAQDLNIPWGRPSESESEFVPLMASSIDAENTSARIGPVLISEINYHAGLPSLNAIQIAPELRSNDLEFIEVYNSSNEPHDISNWRVSGQTDFEFSESTVLSPHQIVVLVTFDTNLEQNTNLAEAFRVQYGIDEGVQLLGPFTPNLQADFGRMDLLEKGTPNKFEPGFTQYLLHDRTRFDRSAPWPQNADGFGESINRNSIDAFGAIPESWEGAAPSPGTSQLVPPPPLSAVVSEIMVAPAPPTSVERFLVSGVTSRDFQFIELFNPNNHRSLDLSKFELSGDIEVTFPTSELKAADYGVIVANKKAFEARYGTDIPILAVWIGELDNQRTVFGLTNAQLEDVALVDITWDALWPLRSRVAGASLEINDVSAITDGVPTHPSHWSGSGQPKGTPGVGRSAPRTISINEVLAGSTSLDAVSDSIEIYNWGSATVDIGGLFLSNRLDEPLKFQIPNNTRVAPGRSIVFDEDDFNPTPLNPSTTDFALDAEDGDQIWLVAASDGLLQSFVDEIEFSSQREAVSIGRIPNGQGDFISQSVRSFGSANQDARFGPIVISEVNFAAGEPSSEALAIDATLNPNDLEFIELYNSSSSPIDLSNWQIEGSTTFQFGENFELSGFGSAVIVSFEINEDTLDKLQAFRTHYQIRTGTSIVGGYDAMLLDGFGSLRLLEPISFPGEQPDSTLHVEHDYIRYDTISGWPVANDGLASLQRDSLNMAGHLPASWVSGNPTPGSTKLAPAPPQPIAISEIMYAPTVPTQAELELVPDVTPSSFEFIELFNPNVDISIALTDFHLSGDIAFAFPVISVAPQEHIVIVADADAFQVRYAGEISVAGQWIGELPDDGTEIQLKDETNRVIRNLSIGQDRRWPARARGLGSSLDFTNFENDDSNSADSWHASTTFLGTPGRGNSPEVGIVINEVSADASEDEDGDFIELFNASDRAIDLSNWYLSDSLELDHFYRIPDGTSLGSGGYMIVDESQLKPDLDDPNPLALTLDAARGGNLWLFAKQGDAISQFVDQVEYGPRQDSTSWGRIPNGSGALIPNALQTLGAENSQPHFGPVLISELGNNPTLPTGDALQIDSSLLDSDLVFVELYNSSESSIDVSEWRMGVDVDFEFSDQTIIQPNQLLVVVTFDPLVNTNRANAFRTHYKMDQSVRLIGGLTSDLRADFGELTILEPGTPIEADPEFTPFYLHDTIIYDDSSSWPDRAAGETLNRSVIGGSGYAADSWSVEVATPGTSTLVPISPMLLPDLTLWVDPLLGFNQLEMLDMHQASGHRLMRFATATANIGRGPLVIHERDEQVVQIIQHEDGSTSEQVAGDFVFHPTHNHIHFDDYALYNLREITESGEPGEIVAAGEKVSFCLADFSPFDLSIDSAPETWVYTVCESATQGISVGWADVYAADLDDQWIDIEDVESGEYWLETVIDPSNRLMESDETNNRFLSKVILGVPEYEADFLDADGVNDLALGTGDKQVSDLSIHRPGDIDTFRWIAPENGEMSVDIGFDRGQGDVDLYIWGGTPTGRQILASSTTDDVIASASTQVEKGKIYFIVVKDLAGHTNPSYQLSVDGPDVLADIFEENDVIFDAVDLGSGNQLHEGLTAHTAGDRDYYGWTAEESGQALVTIQFSNVEGDLDLFVHDFLEHTVHRSEGTRNQESITFDAVQGETYVFNVVAKPDALNSDYSLQIELFEIPSDPYEPNDTDRSPVDIGAGSLDLEDLSIHVPFDRDFFRWEPTAAGVAQFDLSFSHDEGDLDLVIWVNGESTEFASSRDDHEHLSVDVDPEDEYMIEVRSHDNATNPHYDLSIVSPQAARVAMLQLGGTGRGTNFFDLLSDTVEARTVPWNDIDQLIVQFTAPVKVDLQDLELAGLDEVAPAIVDFDYDADRFSAVWTLAAPLVRDEYTLTLHDFIQDQSNNLLDGDLSSGSVKLPSGDGTPGGDFIFKFEVVPGDFNGDSTVDIGDVDLFSEGKRGQDLQFDLTGDGLVDALDLNTLVIDILGSNIGDSNLDGSFNSSDLIAVFQAGEYEDQIPGNSSWAEGDWNLDGDFDTNDLVVAFTTGTYSSNSVYTIAEGFLPWRLPLKKRSLRDLAAALVWDLDA